VKLFGIDLLIPPFFVSIADKGLSLPVCRSIFRCHGCPYALIPKDNMAWIVALRFGGAGRIEQGIRSRSAAFASGWKGRSWGCG
jgi:hypothetical protein